MKTFAHKKNLNKFTVTVSMYIEPNGQVIWKTLKPRAGWIAWLARNKVAWCGVVWRGRDDEEGWWLGSALSCAQGDIRFTHTRIHHFCPIMANYDSAVSQHSKSHRCRCVPVPRFDCSTPELWRIKTGKKSLRLKLTLRGTTAATQAESLVDRVKTTEETIWWLMEMKTRLKDWC